MNQQSAQRAIKAALAGNWDEAIEFNLQVLKDSPKNIEALNRLARAYSSIGQTKNAKRTWNKVLQLDRYNPIAKGQLEKLKTRSDDKTQKKDQKLTTSGQTFLDEPGKTKTTQLVRLAGSKILNTLAPGQTVKLITKKRCVAVATEEEDYIGSFPDDLSAIMVKFIKGGNKYAALIRRVEKNSVHVFIKEKSRSKRFQNFPSFSGHKLPKPISITPTGPINESPIDIVPTGEEEAYK